MNNLSVWDNVDLFKDVDFSVLDRKIRYIQRYREQNELCDKIIKELNNRIDIEFIKDSEAIEGNEVYALQDVDFDEDFQELYDTNIFDKKVRKPYIDEFYLGKYRTIMQDGVLKIFRQDPKTKKISLFKCNMPTHLQALKLTMMQGRQDKALIDKGVDVKVKGEFIEQLHHMLFDYYILLNTRLNRDPNGPPVKPEGYGKFRRTIFINGNEHKYNVFVEGANWQPTDSDNVATEIQELLDRYNSSKLHPILKAIIFKACFVKIHPFRDGNGRVSRLLLNYMLVRNGIPTVTIRGTHKDKYFLALDEAIENNDYSLLIDLVRDELNQRCDQYINLIKKFKAERKLIDDFDFAF